MTCKEKGRFARQVFHLCNCTVRRRLGDGRMVQRTAEGIVRDVMLGVSENTENVADSINRENAVKMH